MTATTNRPATLDHRDAQAIGTQFVKDALDAWLGTIDAHGETYIIEHVAADSRPGLLDGIVTVRVANDTTECAISLTLKVAATSHGVTA